MNSHLHKLLDYLSGRVDDNRCARSRERFQRTLRWLPVDRPPLVITLPFPAEFPFQPYPHREIFDDPEKMLYNELVTAFDTSVVLHDRIGVDLPLTVRANFGTVLVAAMFGAAVEQSGDNPPWIVHADPQPPSLRQIAAMDARDFSRGWIPRAAAVMQAYHGLLEDFPVLKQSIRIVLPDLQGPFDNLELICGSTLFSELITDPDAVALALDAMTAAQIELAQYFGQWTTEPEPGFACQHAVMLRGNILIRNDSCIMISPQMYREQIAPHDERVLRELGGGGIHSCGAIAHLVDEYLQLPSLCALDLGQPELNDADAIYRKAAPRKIPILRVAVSAAEILSGEAWRRFPTGVVCLYRAADYTAARRVADALTDFDCSVPERASAADGIAAGGGENGGGCDRC